MEAWLNVNSIKSMIDNVYVRELMICTCLACKYFPFIIIVFSSQEMFSYIAL